MSSIAIGYSGDKDRGNISFAHLSSTDRLQHHYITGKSGTGKTTLIRNMVVQDMWAGRGVVVLDPHGDLADDLLALVPKNRANDVVYLNPADTEYPIALNMLDAQGDQSLVASSVVSIFKHQWSESWGPRLEYILYNTIAALLDSPNETLEGAYRMLIDQPYRLRIAENIQDPMVRLFWSSIFTSWSERFASEAVSPIQNKLGQLLASSMMRNILCSKKRALDLSFAWRTNKIIIANLSKGLLGENRSSLLGSIIITKLYLAALERAKIPHDKRNNLYVYIDEFPHFTGESITSILSEARKYGLNLILANQHLEQLDDAVRASVFGNVGTFCVFRVGSEDGQYLEREFEPYFSVEDLRIQENHQMICKRMEQGRQTKPEWLHCLPPLSDLGKTAQKEMVIQASRMRYAGTNIHAGQGSISISENTKAPRKNFRDAHGGV